MHECLFRASDATIALQPVYDLDSDGVIGFFESTLRVTKTSDPLFHVRLLSLAEELGFVHLIDMHVLSMTVATLLGNAGMKASINVSQRSIQEDGQEYIRCVERSGVANRLIVEITESTEIPARWVAAFAAGLREIGCQIAVDDFETGCADDALVRAVKPSLIKVVVDDVSATYRERIRRTVALANEIGAEVVCEKIDSESKIALSKSLGARYLQGYCLSHPIMKCDLEDFLGRRGRASIPTKDRAASGIRLNLARFFQSFGGHGRISLE